MNEERQAEQPTSEVSQARHVFVWRTFRGIPFQHHGVLLGDRTVVHYCDASGAGARPKGNVSEFQIRRTSLADFTDNQQRALHFVDHENPRRDCQIQRRALRFVGRTGIVSSDYELTTQNCEHFAHWCVSGDFRSRQVVIATERAASACVKIQVMLSTRLLTSSAGTPLRVAVGASRVGTPWMLASDAVRFATEAFGAKVGLRKESHRQCAGRVLSGGVAVALGCMAGPVGLLGSVGAWAAGEAVAVGVSRKLFSK